MVTVGFVGAGQLARMAQQAAIPLGVHLRVLAERADDSAAQVVPDTVVGDYRDLEDLRRFAKGCDVVTFDHELTDPDHLRTLAAEGCRLSPPPEAKRYAQDKHAQRERLASLGFPVPANAVVAAPADVERFAAQHAWPVVVKAVRGGYDGRGVWVVEDASAADRVVAGARDAGVRLLAEEHVDIATEVAVVVARRASGEQAVYPAVETVQVGGICNEVIAPARLPADVLDEAGRIAAAIAEAIGVVGVLAVELFVTRRGAVVVNELAARPHNSGHWTIEGAVTSQFANHLRAVCDLPLGATAAVAPAAVMVNVLGRDDGADPRDLLPAALRDERVAVHLYGKAPRPGRKLGHVTAVGDDVDEVRGRARAAAEALGRPVGGGA